MQLSLHVPESGMCNIFMIGWKNFALKMHGLYTCQKKPTFTNQNRGIGVCHFIESLLVDGANHQIPVGISCQL